MQARWTSGFVVLLVFSFAPALASDTELRKYESDIRYVEDGDPRFGYDAELVKLSDAQRVADAMRQTYGDAGFPLVFKVPGVDRLFLVSSFTDAQVTWWPWPVSLRSLPLRFIPTATIRRAGNRTGPLERRRGSTSSRTE